ncbi:MAG: DNA-binding protein [Gammaproteobacteria bacterium]|nr:MAG: DNA-binding protein [Gammaproteobacteria bacterium]
MEIGKWLTLDELAEYLKLSTSNLYRMTQKGEIPASKIGNRWRFDRDEIDTWMKSQKPIADNRHINAE